jgi:hypothetical protein
MLALRLILVLVIAASAGVIALGELKLKPHLDKLAEDKKKVDGELTAEKTKSSKLTTDLNTTKTERDGLQNDLNQSKTAEANAQKAAEAERQKAAAAGQETNKAKQETAAVKAQAAEYFDLQKLGLTPPVIIRINQELPKATNENNTLKIEQRVTMTELLKKSSELSAFLNPKGAIALPTGLRGKISAVDPKWGFVVLDIGANHGLAANGELTIHRDGKYLARVKVAKVDTDFAVANVMPEFKTGEVREGDEARTPTPMALPPKK